MKKTFKCFPVGDLPYTTDKAATKMIVKLFENIPSLVSLPALAPNESLLARTLSNIPGVIIKDKKIFFKGDSPEVKKKLVVLDSVYNNPNENSLSEFSFDSYFIHKYFQIIDRIKPQYTVVNLLGPFTIFQHLTDRDYSLLITDKFYRKVIIQAVTVKALWMISLIKTLSPDTTPIIVLEEHQLHKAGTLKRQDEELTDEVFVNMFSKVITKIHEFGGVVCVQSFNKCDWKIPIDAGVDMISFDAYNNPNNLNIIPDKINEFMARGGIINWAIVPVNNEEIVRNLSVDYIYDRLCKTFEGLIEAGTSEKLVYNRATVSILGNINHLPLIMAEKALITASQVASKIPVKS